MAIDHATAIDIAVEIRSDMQQRQGFDALWDEIPPDVQDDIVDEWVRIIEARAGEAGASEGVSG